MILISFILTIYLFSSKLVSAETCQAQDTCECMYNDGSGYSLKNLLQPPNEHFINGYAQNSSQIYFSPCVDSKNTPSFPPNSINDCKNGYTLCYYNATENHAHVLGTAKDTQVKEIGGQIFLIIGSANISSVLLQCTVNSKTSTLYSPPDTSINSINLTLFSNSACKAQLKKIEGPGFFSTFFLIAFIVLLVYLVVGILYNYFFVGARGYELIPNYDFWTKLWTSMKLGFYFVKNGFKVVPTEDSYDAI